MCRLRRAARKRGRASQRAVINFRPPGGSELARNERADGGAARKASCHVWK